MPTSWHWSWAVHTTGLVPVQVPAWHVSVWVHALPSLQVAPSALTGFEHVPVAELQVPAMWHESWAVQTMGFWPVQAPAWQESVCVQGLPSSQDAPFGLLGLEHVPVAVLQVPTLWHWSWAAQTTGFWPVQVPAWQESVCVQALPSLHAVPSAVAA